MSIDLPAPISAYFKTDKSDSDAVMACFTEDAEVTDEGHTHEGLAAIKKWKADSSTKYTYTSELLSLEKSTGLSIVTARLTGNFPGSPVDLRYRFRLHGNKIASLEIAP